MKPSRVFGIFCALLLAAIATAHVAPLRYAQAQEREGAVLVERGANSLPGRAEIIRVDVEPAEVAGVANASRTTDRQVYFGSQPTKEAVADLVNNAGVKVVINLRRPEELAGLGFDEKAAVETGGAKYVQVPMGAELPTAEALKPAFDALSHADEDRVFLHCASGNRVGAVWALYAGTRGGLSVDNAITQGKRAGLKSPALEAAVRKRLEEDSAAE